MNTPATTLSPETITAVEILESISQDHRDQAVEMLRKYAQEVRSEQRWTSLLSKHDAPIKNMAAQALKAHRQGKSQEM
jgi:hypothetical protein